MGKWYYTWKSKYIIMKKNNNLDLISEINLILNQMGLEPNNSFLVESKLLLSEGVNPDDVAKAVYDWLGIGVRTTQEIGDILEKNPIELRLPKVGSDGVEIISIRSIDDLVAAAGKAKGIYNNLDEVGALKKLFDNTEGLKSNIGKSILDGDVNTTITRYIEKRSSTKKASAGQSNNPDAQTIYTEIDKRMDSILETLDISLGKTTPTDNTKIDLDIDDFKSGENLKLSEELIGDGTKYFSDIISAIDKKINILNQKSKIYQTFVDDVRLIIQKSNLSANEKSQFSEMLNKISDKGQSTIKTSVDDLTTLRRTTAELNVDKGAEAEEFILKRDPEAEELFQKENTFSAYNMVRLGAETLGATTKITQLAFEGISWVINRTWGELRRNWNPGYEFDKSTWNMLKPFAERYKKIYNLSMSWVESFIQMAKLYNKSKKISDNRELIISTLEGSKKRSTFEYSYEETKLISKKIISEMLKLSKEYSEKITTLKGTKGSSEVYKARVKQADVMYKQEMNNLARQLQSTFEATDKGRFYIQEGDFELQKLEDIVKEFNSLINDMALNNIKGSTEFKIWWDESVAKDGELVSFFQIAKWLDDDAIARNIPGTFKTKSLNWSDIFFLAKNMKPTLRTIADKAAAFRKKVIKYESSETKTVVDNANMSPEEQKQFKGFWDYVFKEGSNKFTNLITYGAYTDADQLQRLLTIYGPVKGLFAIAARETITHTIVVAAFNIILEGLIAIDSFFGSIGSDKADHPGAFMLIYGLNAFGDRTDSQRYKQWASIVKDRVKADFKSIFIDPAIAALKDWKTTFAAPLFVQNASIATTTLRLFGMSDEDIETYIDGEYSRFNSSFDDVTAPAIELILNWWQKPDTEYGEAVIKKYDEVIKKQMENLTNTGYIYSGLSNSDAAKVYKEDEKRKINVDLQALTMLGDGYGFPDWTNETFTDIDGKTKTIKDGLMTILDFPDEPTSTYKFSDGSTYDFSFNATNGGYSQHYEMAKKWWNENKGKIGIQDFINQVYYPIYPSDYFTSKQIDGFVSENKIKIKTGTPSNGYVLIYNPKDGIYYDFALLGDVIPKDKLIKLINTDNLKRKVKRAEQNWKIENDKIEKTEGLEIKKLLRDREYMDKYIADAESKGQNDPDSPYYDSYVRAYKVRYGTKNENGKYVKWYDEVAGKEIMYIDYDEQIEKALKEYEKKKNENDKIYNQTVKGSAPKINENTTNYYSNIINDYLLVNNIKQNNMKNLKHKLIESKRFDEDDYKHWKDTFTFQAVDEKNPGQYKDVKLNMDDVMDRIPHYRKKYDEDDSFVRAVVDTHENVVRFMFTKDLANIREGYSPVGFAKILQQLREARGENEIWSVARPASGNWFLVKGDFTPKELMGMDLEKNEPADREPKKRENSLETLKKKELTSAEGLKNDEKSGFNELPKVVKEKLREKFNNGWTTEEPVKNLKSFYSDSEVKSVFGDSIKIYKLNTNSDFFDSISNYSDSLPIKRGFCRSIHLAKQNYNLSDENKNTIRGILKICNNKFNDFLGLSNMS